jgi:transposase
LPALKKKVDLFDLIMEVGIDELTLRPTKETTGPCKRERPTKIAINATTRDHICSTASKLKADVPTVGELRFEFAERLRLHGDPAMRNLLNCKIENLLSSRGDDWVWTPPYTPTIQPIEIFWGIVKNNAARRYENGRTMRECIEHLREGWYGGEHEPNLKAFAHVSYDDLWPDEDTPAKATHLAKRKAKIVVKRANCPGICRKILRNANAMVKMFEDGDKSLQGTIEKLTMDPNAKWIDKLLRDEADIYGFDEVKHLAERHVVNPTCEHDLELSDDGNTGEVDANAPITPAGEELSDSASTEELVAMDESEVLFHGFSDEYCEKQKTTEATAQGLDALDLYRKQHAKEDAKAAAKKAKKS